MKTNDIIKTLNSAFAGLFFDIQSIPEETDAFEVNIFGATENITDKIQESLFDIEDQADDDLILIPIFYTKQEMLDHYPAITAKYQRQTSELAAKTLARLLRTAALDVREPSCSCSSDGPPNLSNFSSAAVSPLWRGKISATDEHLQTTINADFALAA